MNEALEWLQHTPEADRKLVGLALQQLARGATRVNWRRSCPALGKRRGGRAPDALWARPQPDMRGAERGRFLRCARVNRGKVT
jgi:hypothetical protein